MNGRAILGACALVEEKWLNHFKNILKKKEKFNQLWTDFFTPPLANRQRPATEDQEIYLE